MIRFHFQLTPMDQLSEATRASWYFLSDGWYWITVGESTLFRWTDAVVASWRDERDPTELSPYAEYYVARFWQDLLTCFRQAWLPIPDDIAALLEDRRGWEAFLQRSEVWAAETEDDLSRWDLRNDALFWWWERQLDSGHFVESPTIALWRYGDQLVLEWSHHRNPEHFTAPAEGRASVDANAFLTALQEFDRAFLAQMAERVKGNAELERSHLLESGLLENTLEHPRNEDWPIIRQALQRLRDEMRETGAVQ